jgi:hypothetical protein
MDHKRRKYIYLSNKDFDGTVFQTQVLDWLHLFELHNLEFNLIQAFHIKDLRRPANIKFQLNGIRSKTKLFMGHIYLLPSKNFYYIFNTIVIFFKIFKYFFKYQEILIFSRALIGKEISFLRKISPAKIIFYFDARAASAEENKYMAIKNKSHSINKYKTIAQIYYLEYKTLELADKVFVVSGTLRKYFQETYNTNDQKFILYPCLADANKFCSSSDLRREVRSKLQITKQTKVFIYSGGINSEWHISEKMFSFFNQLLRNKNDVLLLCLTKDETGLEKTLAAFPEIKPKILSFSVPNEEVCKYLNAADYGLLFRENTIMNNVASPTKYAEYILCGLPVLISEGVGDYSNYTLDNDLGFVIKEKEMKNPEQFDFKEVILKEFDREYIAEIGKKFFSKDSIISNLITVFKT